MNKICIVLTSEGSNFSDVAGDVEETVKDMETIQEVMSDHKIIEIKIPVSLSSHQAEQKIIEQLSKEVLENASSCHIIVNSHGNITKKDVQDAAVKKIIERVSENLIPISQLTLLICYAMAKDNSELAHERLIAKRGHTAEFVETVSPQETTAEVLIKKLRKMKLPIPQHFEVFGPSSAYNPFSEEQLVAATIRGEILQGRNERKAVTIEQLSIEAYKERMEKAIKWLEDNAGGLEIETPRVETFKSKLDKGKSVAFEKSYDTHVTLLGKVLDELFSKLVEKYKTLSNRGTTELDVCHFLHEKLLAYARINERPIDNLNDLKAVFRLWKKDFRANSRERLSVYKNYISLDHELFYIPCTQHQSRINTPPPSPELTGSSALLTEKSIFFKPKMLFDEKVDPKEDPNTTPEGKSQL